MNIEVANTGSRGEGWKAASWVRGVSGGDENGSPSICRLSASCQLMAQISESSENVQSSEVVARASAFPLPGMEVNGEQDSDDCLFAWRTNRASAQTALSRTSSDPGCPWTTSRAPVLLVVKKAENTARRPSRHCYVRLRALGVPESIVDCRFVLKRSHHPNSRGGRKTRYLPLVIVRYRLVLSGEDMQRLCAKRCKQHVRCRSSADGASSRILPSRNSSGDVDARVRELN